MPITEATPEKHYTSLIQKHFPHVELNNTRLLTHGWDNDVLIVDEQLVFRFPKREEYQERFKAELRLLDYLRSKVNVAIPHYTYLAPDQSFGGYELLKGQEMRPALLKQLPEDKKQYIAQQLGTFISVIHSVPLQKAQEMGFQEEEGGHYWSKADAERRFGLMQKLVFPKLTLDEQQWITNQFQGFLSLPFEYQKVLLHSDFTQDHILLDTNSGEVSGIIDFADAEIGDPMLDFAGMWDYGDDFPHQVLANYTGPADDNLLKRSRYPLRFEGPATMLEILEGKHVPRGWEESEQILRSAMEQFAKRKGL